ncbi:hypothetical protein E1281_21445 [Actinomadura sp. KC345]|uniref:hypothetical protein n=1 Tax=Actinomadura sp. KC345 TaxID=2530371 RepID=UPI001045821D|nr:hypothetical protein [Actinomadura sp. KC345]TDC50794.1 hypothetical protein E1281_21445 [Actinomadura sp. KC345]
MRNRVKRYVVLGLLAIGLSTLVGVLLGGAIGALDYAVFIGGLDHRYGRIPAGFTGSDVIAHWIRDGAGDGLILGAIGGYLGACVGAAFGAGFIRNNTALVMPAGAVLGIGIGFGVVAPAGVSALILGACILAVTVAVGARVIDR